MSAEKPPQLNEYDMRRMTHDQIREAFQAGRFADLLDPDIAPTLPHRPMGDYTKDKTLTEPEQLTQADLAGMSPAAIVKAQADGRLADILRKPQPAGPDWPYDPNDAGQLTPADLAKMTPAQIVEARAAGRLTAVLNGWPDA